MLHFTKVLHVENYGFLYFSFKCTHSPENNKCQVQVWTEGEQCHNFVMDEKHDTWNILQTPLPPQWILKLEDQLETAIFEYHLHRTGVPSKFRLWQLPKNTDKTAG
jgi:hypothetical protein